MVIDTVFAIYAVALTLTMAVMIGGFTLVFMELHRVAVKVDAIPDAFATLRHDLSEDLAAQRAEAARQLTVVTNAILAARGER
jgi:hypothetical protein